MNKIYNKIVLFLCFFLSMGITVAQTVSLTSLEASINNRPAGTSVTWHTARPANGTNLVSNPAAVPAGVIYYAAFFDAANNCYSSNSVAVPTATNTCPAVTVNLTSLETGITNKPTGTVVTWHTAQPANGTNLVANKSAVATGTYYAAFFDNVNNCYSSFSTPVLVSTTTCTSLALTNICPATTVNLNTAVSTTNLPAGTTLTWHSGVPITNANKIADPTTVGAGTYYAAFFDSANNCYSPASQSVVVTIVNCNKPPIATNDIAVTPQDKPVSGNVLTNDTDPNGGTLTVTTTPTVPPTKGTVVLNPNGTYVYTPNTGQTGNDTFCYEVTNTAGLKDTACVSVTMVPTPTAANDAPIANNDNTETPKNTPVIIAVKANDSDPDAAGTPNGTLGTPTAVSPPTNGTVVYNANGTVTYTPNTGFVGTDTFVYNICDGGTPALCDNATVTVLVKEPAVGNQPPVAVDDVALTEINTPVSGNVSANDTDPDNNTPLTFTKLTNPVNGTVVFNGDGTYVYTPATGFVGSDAFTYQVCDALGLCDKATVSIGINPATPKVALSPKVWLQGSLFGVTGAGTFMRDDLRSKNLIPLGSPYPAMGMTEATVTLPTTNAVLSVTGQDAIVDWVYVELRDATDATIIRDTRSALVQRDGDIVEVDGISNLTFAQVGAGSYYVAVKHRNHLGVMTASPVALTGTTTIVDFRTPATPTFNLNSANITNQPQVVVDQGVALWAGNALYDNQVIYQGTQNDVNPIFQAILVPGNLLNTPFYKLKTYNNSDIDMNGETIFQGNQNDVEFIYQNIIKNHPGNILRQDFFIIKQQLP